MPVARIFLVAVMGCAALAGCGTSNAADLANPAADELAESVTAAYRKQVSESYADAVAKGYTGNGLAVNGTTCNRTGDASFECTISATVSGQGANAPTSVSYPVSVDSEGCWVADREDEYSAVTRFTGCVK